MENQHLSWENSLFLWQFSIAMLNYQRVLYLYHLCPNRVKMFPKRKSNHSPTKMSDDVPWFVHTLLENKTSESHYLANMSNPFCHNLGFGSLFKETMRNIQSSGVSRRWVSTGCGCLLPGFADRAQVSWMGMGQPGGRKAWPAGDGWTSTFLNGGFLGHRGTPSHHLLLDGIYIIWDFPWNKPSSYGGSPCIRKPPNNDFVGDSLLLNMTIEILVIYPAITIWWIFP